MMVDERETVNGHGCDLNCSMEPTTEATADDKDGLLLDGNGSSGGVSCGEGTSAERLIIYERRKRRKMSKSDEKTTAFNDKIKHGDGSASDQDVPRLSFGQGEFCKRTLIEQRHQSLNGNVDGLRKCTQNTPVTYPESGCKSAIKDNSERSDKQTHYNSSKQLEVVTSNGLLNQSELCGRAFSDILRSDSFSKLFDLLVKNFGVVNVNQILGIDAIKTRMKSGVYQTSGLLYHTDIQQVWTKLQLAGNEMVTLAKSLSDQSRGHHEQFMRKPKATASNCQGCGGSAHPQNCLVCDSCEEIYHVSCSDLIGPEMPPKTWYCPTCVSNGIGSPHDNCIVCEKLKSTATIPRGNPNGLLTDVEPDGSDPDPDLPEPTDAYQGSKACYICKSDVNAEDNFRTCGHSLCAHKFYHCHCLTSKQLGVSGPCWYCPSCLCRRCMVDKDDDQIVLCDGCDQAYHIYCTTPQLYSIPTGKWFCGKCDRDVKRIKAVKKLYQDMQKKVKVEEGSAADDSGGLEMLVTAAKTLSHQETIDGYNKGTVDGK